MACKSGFAGELGHFNAFDNEILCHCGKKGCMETEVSGMALYRNLVAEVKAGKCSILSSRIETEPEAVTIGDIIDAVNSDDSLCIELIENIGHKLGRQLAGMINIFNPELVVIGGMLAEAQEYLLQPVRQGVRKYSLSLVNRDSWIVCSRLGEKAGVIGACHSKPAAACLSRCTDPHARKRREKRRKRAEKEVKIWQSGEKSLTLHTVLWLISESC